MGSLPLHPPAFHLPESRRPEYQLLTSERKSFAILIGFIDTSNAGVYGDFARQRHLSFIVKPQHITGQNPSPFITPTAQTTTTATETTANTNNKRNANRNDDDKHDNSDKVIGYSLSNLRRYPIRNEKLKDEKEMERATSPTSASIDSASIYVEAGRHLGPQFCFIFLTQ